MRCLSEPDLDAAHAAQMPGLAHRVSSHRSTCRYLRLTTGERRDVRTASAISRVITALAEQDAIDLVKQGVNALRPIMFPNLLVCRI